MCIVTPSVHTVVALVFSITTDDKLPKEIKEGTKEMNGTLSYVKFCRAHQKQVKDKDYHIGRTKS